MLELTFEVEYQAHHDFQIQMDWNIIVSRMAIFGRDISTLVATYDCDRYRDCLAKKNIVAFDLFEYVHLNRELQLGLPKMVWVKGRWSG